MAFSYLFREGNIAQEQVFYDILEGQNAFLRYKNKKFKKSKDWDFFKGVNPWFWPKIGHFFHLFCEGNIGLCVLRYSSTVKEVAKLGFVQRG